MPTIIDCLGREREPSHIYPDGSYNCPFCSAAVTPVMVAFADRKCPNPACFAHGGIGVPSFPVERARELMTEQERAERERQERAHLAEWHQQHAAEQRAAENARLDAVAHEARTRGACARCALDSARYSRPAKYIRHRKGCPQETRRT